MLKEDNDIKDINDDRLNRANFAKNLSLNIKNYFDRNEVNNCLTIGLMGEWGSGKTSILNMVEYYLKDSEIKIIKFNPWLYSSYNQLVEQFLDELIRGFTYSRDNSLIDILKRYKFKVNNLEVLKKLASSASLLCDSKAGNIVENILSYSSDEENLASLKEKIDEQFVNHKVVCIIDDLDRLSRDEISEMFKLIKIMADFKNMVYLVSFDKDVVANALKNDYGSAKYIEKIINVPLYVPLITTDELTDLLLSEVDRLYNQYNLKIDYSRLKRFLNDSPILYEKKFGIIHFFKNIRDIKRFINILEFNIELIKDEVNFVDFFVLTALQVFHLDIYNKIKHDKFLLTDHHYYDGFAFSKEKIIESKKEDFEKFCDDENITKILKNLFPMMNYIYTPNRYDFHFSAFDEQLRICHPNHFNSYFKLNDVVKDLPEKEVNSLVDMINSNESEEIIFKNLNDLGIKKISLFFRYMLNRIDRIIEKQYFIRILFLSVEELEEGIYNSNLMYIEDLIINLLYKIDKEYRFDILKESFRFSSNIQILFDIWQSINDKNYNIYVANEEILSQDELDILNCIIKDKVKELINILPRGSSKFMNILRIGLMLNSIEENNKIVADLLLTNEDIISFLKIFISEHDSSNFLLKDIKQISEVCDIKLVKFKVDELPQEYSDNVIINKFLDGYELFNDKSSG